jgi:GT2 family glycosyltransferase
LAESSNVAIVILNWNGKKYLETFLPSVIASTYSNLQVIIADNGSTDDSIAFLKSHYPAIRIITLEKNYGFAKGYNEALKQVQADYYMLLNSDVEVTPNWIEPMVTLLDSNVTIAACQPKLLAYADKNRFEYAGAAGGWIDNHGYPFSRGRVFEFCETDQLQYNQQEPIFWASGAALFIRSTIFHQAKGFDEFFFAHQEEIDLCWRIQLLGYQIYSEPSSVVYHVGGGTLPRGNSRKTFLNFRNNLIMLYKNEKASRKIWLLPFRISLDAITAWKGLLSGDGGYFIAIVKAHFAFLGWILNHRKQSTFPASKTAKLLGRYNGSVVWQHFIKKKQTFSEIVRRTH